MILQWIAHKKNLLAITCIATTQTLFTPVEGKLSGKEALSLRRIAEFWKDGDYEIARKQIIEFLSQFPESSAKDHLSLMLGDLYFQEKKYQEAYTAYEAIIDEEIIDQTLFSRLSSLFALKEYEAVVKNGDAYFKKERKKEEALEAHYLIAESLVRLALSASHPDLQKKWTDQALVHYQAIESTPYQTSFLFAFAELQKLLKNYPEAINTYLHLAERYPGQAEDLLFQAATLQVFHDKSAAVDTFKRVSELKGKTAKAATFNYLSLLLEMEKYEELLTAYEKQKDYIPENKVSLIQFYLGASHFALSQFTLANQSLLNYLASEPIHQTQHKRALVYLVNSAQITHDLPLLDQAIENLKKHFPQDLALAKSLLLRAQLLIDQKELRQAFYDLQEIRNQFPSFGDQETILYTSAFLQFQLGDWKESRTLFQAFLEKFPSSAHFPLICRHLINCSLKLGDKQETLTHLENLLTTQHETLTIEETREVHFLISKMLYETSQYKEALIELEKYINAFAYASNLSEAHLLSANCHQHLGSQPEFFIFHAEKALSLKPALIHVSLLHLHLFNAYLALGNHDLQAAEHLAQVVLEGTLPVKWENQLWLTDFYLTYAKTKSESLSCAKELFHKLYSSTQDTLTIEALILNYADLLSHCKSNEEKIKILTTLVQKQEENPNQPWKYQRRSLFELARAYEESLEVEKALTLYDQLINQATYISSYTGAAAQLHRTRLRFSSLTSEQKDENNPLFSEILNDLKELQIRKNIQSEPIHLEAALDYATLRCNHLPAEEKRERLLFFLNRIKEDFTSDEDIVSKDYTTARTQNAEKELLFQSYINYVNAKILQANGNLDEANRELQMLLSQSDLHPYLKMRIQKEQPDA